MVAAADSLALNSGTFSLEGVPGTTGCPGRLIRFCGPIPYTLFSKRAIS